MREFWRHVWAWRSYLVLLLTPLLLSPLPIALGSSESKCAFVVLLMAVYWVSECLPVGVTALIPVVLFPFFEIMGPDDIAKTYMNDIQMLFLGGLMVAVAIEYWDIHKKVALRILTWVGAEPRWLMLGMMTSTWFLSMWISNTASTAMMLPITEAILVELEQRSGDDSDPTSNKNDTKVSVQLTDTEAKINQKNSINSVKETEMIEKPINTGEPVDSLSKNNDPMGQPKTMTSPPSDPHFNRVAVGMLLSICYAANCGGIASLTGTGPNLVLKREVDSLYESQGLKSPISFGKWMTFGLPVSLVMFLICWFWLQIFFLRCRGMCSCCRKDDPAEREKKQRVIQIIRDQYNAMGSLVCGQVMVILFFLCLVLLWITRDMGGVAGWGSQFTPHVKDGTAGVLIALLIFAAPSTFPFLKSYANPSHPETDPRFGRVTEDTRPRDMGLTIYPLLNWRVARQKFSWQIILLLGGGFAISAGCKASNLSQWIGDQLTYFRDWNDYAILFIICYITAAATEFASNTAMSSIMMPILQRLALSTQNHPIEYMLPACIASSFAFMLPVATPPNAIVFSTGRLKISDMMQAGIMMNLLAVPALVFLTFTLGTEIYDLDNIPAQFLNMSSPSVVNA